MKTKIIVFCLLLLQSIGFASTFVVDNTADTDDAAGYTFANGTNTLRKCVRLTNAAGGADIINFSIGACTITIASSLTLTGATTIDGETATGWVAGTPVIRIDGASGAFALLNFSAGASISTVKSLILTRGQSGISISGLNTITIYGCIIGSDNSDAALGNSSQGIYITNSNSINIGNDVTNLSQRNIISKNTGDGIKLDNTGGACNNVIIAGNYIGTNKAGTASNGNTKNGININGATAINTIGGTATTNRNVISGNGTGAAADDQNGIYGTGVTLQVIKANYIGLDALGTSKVGNTRHGIYLVNTSTQNTIGGTSAAERNYISGNGQNGIWLNTSSTNNTVQGNYIGTDITGSVGLGNTTSGIALQSGSGNCTIGGSVAGAGNLISANLNNGIWCNNNTAVNIFGNIIGMNAAGTGALGNAQEGIWFLNTSPNNVVGSSVTATRNLICKSGNNGIKIENNSSGTTIKGNYIGVDINGNNNFGNTLSGIAIQDASSANNIIGGTVSGEGNIISNNGQKGIYIYDADNQIIKGNIIGMNAAATVAQGNVDSGIYIDNNSDNNVIGASASAPSSGESNTIAHNGIDGIHLQSGWYNRFRGNSIFCNVALGINVVSGSNENTVAAPTCSSTNNVASGTCTGNNVIHIYKNTTIGTGCGCEGETYLGTVTGAGGSWSFTHNLNLNAKDQTSVTATQTTALLSTSNFSSCTVSLPVELLSFDGQTNNEYIVLNWITASELNNDAFEILRSADGIHWEILGMVKGSGISTVLKKYAFTDLNPFPGNNYYRLKQIDYDGNFHHSEMIAFNFEPTTLNIEISDNSTTDNVTTLIHGESKQGYILQLYDALGQLVYNNKLHAEIKTNIAVSFLKPGLYFLNVYPVSDISATPSHFLSKKILIN